MGELIKKKKKKKGKTPGMVRPSPVGRRTCSEDTGYLSSLP